MNEQEFNALARDHAARAMLAALKEFRMYYPHGINPNLDEAYAMAGDAIAQAEAAGIKAEG